MVLQGEVCWARKHNQAGQVLPTFTSVAPRASDLTLEGANPFPAHCIVLRGCAGKFLEPALASLKLSVLHVGAQGTQPSPTPWVKDKAEAKGSCLGRTSWGPQPRSHQLPPQTWGMATDYGQLLFPGPTIANKKEKDPA